MTTIDLNLTGDAVVRDLPHDAYLAHAALSASGAKVLVQPGGPARYRHRLDHPEPARDTFDTGHAAHAAVLGVGPELVVIDSPDWRTTAAKTARDLARASGKVPILTSTAQQVADMAAALRQHPIASRLLHTTAGEPEVSLFWHDAEHDVDRRGRVDFLRRPDADGRLIVVDYKTSSSADPGEFARSAARYGYAQQASWYRDLVVGLGLAKSAPFVFVVQEKDPPYLVSVVQLDEASLHAGESLNRRALTLYRECMDAGTWPGLTEDEVAVVSLPPWALAAAEDMTSW